MPSSYPSGYDGFTTHHDNAGERVSAADINKIQDAVVAIELGVGLNPQVTVAAPTGVPAADTAAIHAARDAAGVSGRLIFNTSGTYRTAGLTANVAGQEWTICPGAVIKLADSGVLSHVITVSASGVVLSGGGTIDGNRGVLGTTHTYAGVHGDINAADLIVKDLTVQNTVWWGVWCEGTRSKVRFCRFSGTSTTAVLMSSYSFSPTQQDTYDMEVTGCFVDRSGENPATINNACIQVRGDYSTSGKVTRRGRVTNCTILMVSNPTEPTGLNCGIEFGNGAYFCLAQGNIILGGGLGISFARGDNGIINGNACIGQNLYGIEFADSPNCAITGNTVEVSVLPAIGAGIAATGTGLSQHCTVTGNTISGTTNGASGINISGVPVVINANTVKASNGIILNGGNGSSVMANRIFGEGLTGSRGIYLVDSSNLVVTGNSVRSYANGVEIHPTSGTQDNINISNNFFRQCTTPVAVVTAGGVVGNSIVNVGTLVTAS